MRRTTSIRLSKGLSFRSPGLLRSPQPISAPGVGFCVLTIRSRSYRIPLLVSACYPTYAESPDPAGEINNYIIANGLLTPNIRTDTGQPDAWRDYQQILSELGLIFSTKILRLITPTALGLAFLDGTFEFSEVITMQAFRLQYPNGHHTNISPSLRKALYGTPSEEVTNFAILQDISNVRIRPAVLIWRVLRGLANAGLEPELHMNEVECYLMRCATQHDIDQCLHALKDARQGKVTLPPLQGTARRNAQDWLKFLALTPIFDTAATAIKLSSFALDHRVEIDALCLALERDESFWQPDTLDRTDKLSWHRYFGGVDLSVPPQPLPETEIAQGQIRETEDPSSVDLLVIFRKTDFIIEVKTVTPENSFPAYAMP